MEELTANQKNREALHRQEQLAAGEGRAEQIRDFWV
ncbi:hypothetical protein SLEP1_g22829 [Rubroshorea leprosula]|uniref:Uncharacterized protein n=1 Tax=Rubroshorea leprosula TaxID=152421 RepID=A0AAV5JJ77_9ROSI|nr:hypothetical protein SLEP1_g22829 [Rubroshorea leprosula]